MGSPLPSGTKLGHYQILSQLGAGGMGEVYLAEDARLHRKVALKVLPIELASHSDRMRRFTQEATAAASLNHPNIAHIYETGEAEVASEVLHFIAMEFIDGITLREKIHREHSDLRKLLRYLQQVAEGLAKAHAAGVVHRDLKPDNIMITGDGHAKILDFGLVKLIEPALPTRESASPTCRQSRVKRSGDGGHAATGVPGRAARLGWSSLNAGHGAGHSRLHVTRTSPGQNNRDRPSIRYFFVWLLTV